MDALLQLGYIYLSQVKDKRFVQVNYFSFSQKYYTFDVIDLIIKLSIKLEVGKTAKLLQKLSFRTIYLSFVQKKNPPLPHLWEVRDKK